MIQENIDFIVAFLAIAVYAFFAFYTRRVNTFENFSVGNRNVGFWLLFASISATYIGPGFTMGLTSKGYEFGYFYLFMVIGYAIQIILTGVVIAPALRRKFTTGTYSIGDIVGGKKTHNSKFVHFLTGLVSFGICIGFTAVLSSAGGDILGTFFSVPKNTGILIITIIVMVYSYFGGLLASILTDTFQFILFVVMLSLLVILGFSSNDISIIDFIDKAKELTNSGFKNHSLLVIIGLITSWTFGELLLPPLVSRILSSKTIPSAKRSFVASGIFLVFWLFLMFSTGVLGSFSIEGQPNDLILINMGEQFFKHGLLGLFAVAMIGVIMSSQDSMINTGASIFTRDIVNVFSSSPLTDKRQLIYSRGATILIGFLSYIFATLVPSVIDGLLLCYTVWVPAILVVLLASIFLKNHSKNAAIFSMISGITIAIVWNLSTLKETVPTILVGTTISLAAYILGTILYPVNYDKTNEEL